MKWKTWILNTVVLLGGISTYSHATDFECNYRNESASGDASAQAQGETNSEVERKKLFALGNAERYAEVEAQDILMKRMTENCMARCQSTGKRCTPDNIPRATIFHCTHTTESGCGGTAPHKKKDDVLVSKCSASSEYTCDGFIGLNYQKPYVPRGRKDRD